MVFTLPSLPSGLSALLDTSPPVFYPAPAPKRIRSRSTGAAALTDSPRRSAGINEPKRGTGRGGHTGENASPGPSRPHQPAGPAEPRRHLGNMLAASVSANDISGVWEPLPSRAGGYEVRRGRPHSIAGTDVGEGAMRPRSNSRASERSLPCAAAEPGFKAGTPTRPIHRRSHSAVPFPQAPYLTGEGDRAQAPASLGLLSHPSPMGRLHEFSRNPLASISAVSLPTLAELEIDDDRGARAGGKGDVTDSPRRYGAARALPPSPLVKPHHRPSSRSSAISPILIPTIPSSPVSDTLQLGTSSESTRTEARLRIRTQSLSSVPPPAEPAKQGQIQIHPYPIPLTSPTGTRPARPPLSPRSWTAQDLHSHQSFSAHARRASIDSTTSTSDVAVFASWSFPTSAGETNPQAIDGSEGDAEEAEARGRQPGPSDRLRDRLRSLATLDTALPASSSAPSISAVSASQAYKSITGMASSSRGAKMNENGPVRPSRPLPSYLTNRHRHTHSSPNLLQIPGATAPSTPPTQQTTKGSMGPPPLPLALPNAHPLFPPPRPQRRPTTTRLRQPNPLSMPSKPIIGRNASHTSLVSLAGGTGGMGHLSSSPGSMVSDSSTLCPSPTSSVKSLPVISSVDPPTSSTSKDNVEDKEKGRERAWWAIPSLRSRTRSSARADNNEKVQNIDEGRMDREEPANVVVTSYGSGSPDEEEEYIDMDQM